MLRRQLRETDLPARFGGDEFAALIPGVNLQIARSIAGRVRLAVTAAWSEPQLGVSIGLALSDGDKLRTLQRADKDLYKAKAVAHLRPKSSIDQADQRMASNEPDLSLRPTPSPASAPSDVSSGA